MSPRVPPVPPVRLALMAAALLLASACADSSTAPPAAMPVPAGPSRLLVSAPESFVQLEAGFFHTCAVTTDLATPAREVKCWGGSNESGQTTVPEGARSGMSHASADASHTCAVSMAGALSCWGNNGSGQATVPTTALTGMAQVSTGGSHTCAVSTAGALTCWGDDSQGQTDVPLAAQSGMWQVSAGQNHTCAVSTAAALFCWGSNSAGQAIVPSTVSSVRVNQVSAGYAHTCAITGSGALICWGDNSQGQTDVPPAAQSGMWQVSAGFLHTCARTDAGELRCWGFDSFGQATVPATASTGIASVSAGGYHTCALRSTGAVICWGDNRYGQTNAPTSTNRVLPTATFGAPTTPVVPGQNFTLAITNPQVAGYTSTFTYAFDCGTGTYTVASTSASQSCPTSASGVVLAVRGKVIDRDGDFAEYTASVSVTAPPTPPALTPEQRTSALRTLVDASTLSPELRRALTSKLDDAINSLSAGKTKAACTALADFAKQVHAHRGKAIPVESADLWLVETAAIRTLAGC